MGLSPRKPNSDLSVAKRSKIWTLYEEGLGPTAISNKTDIPRSTISSFLIRHAKSGSTSFKSKPGRGNKPKLSPRAERTLVRIALNEPKMTLKALASPSKSGKELNHHTVSKILKRHGKAKRRPRKKPYLSPLHKKKRRIHCREELKRKRNHRAVIWSDEVTFEIGEDQTTFFVTRGPGRDEEYADKNLRPSFKSGRETVGAWGCFCGDQLGALYILPKGENMNAKRYKWVLQTYMIPFYKKMERIYGDEVVFMEDGAMWHKAKIVKKYLANKGIRMMPHTPQSPDLNPIENVWKRIKDKIAKRKHKARNRLDFIVAMRQEWAEIEGDFLIKLCDSMPTRYQACLKNKGGATKY